VRDISLDLISTEVPFLYRGSLQKATIA